ncbi:hypothetical protein TNCV_1335271 [Trichonephila clavipes]|nr:hypothetical protein TNCV_1335271 [Trichonephila clavipes]
MSPSSIWSETPDVSGNSASARFSCFNGFCISLRRHVNRRTWTVLVSQQLIEMPDIQRSVVDFGTALVSQQFCELPHAPPVQAFAIRLVETFY